LVSVYKEHLGKMKGELREALSACEELGHDYKLVRGLIALLEERCIFGSRAVVSPVDARKAVFKETSSRVVDSEKERGRVLSTVAFRLGISVIDLDRSLYADLEAEKELFGFGRVTPLDLLKEYNFSLVLALLLYAVKVEISFRGRDEVSRNLSKSWGNAASVVCTNFKGLWLS
jgi:predicted nuclease of restriction endonuclease-like RecB superfamily